nr:MAG: DNA pilot protein [Microvirus Sku18]
MDIFGIGSVVGGIAGAFGAGRAAKYNLQAQREANIANMQIAQMNNQYNERMLEKQMDYNVRMWNMENQYNSPEQQVSRMRAAGLNPYMQDVQPGQAGSVGGVSTPTASPVQVQPELLDSGSVQNGINGMVQALLGVSSLAKDNELKDANIQQINIENKYRASSLIAEIASKWANTKNTKLRNMYQKIINNYADENQIADLNQKRQQYAISQMQEKIMATDYALKEMQTAAYPEQLKLQLAQMSADIGLTAAQKGYTEEQTRKSVQDRLESIARTNGIKIDNKTRRLTMDAAVRLAEAKAQEAENNKYPRDVWQWSFGDNVIGGEVYRYGSMGLDAIKGINIRNQFNKNKTFNRNTNTKYTTINNR